MRPGHEIGSFPGEVNARIADAVIVNKVSQAGKENTRRVVNNIRSINPKARISLADMEVRVDRPDLIEGRRVVVIEDSPSVTHGGLPYGAGYVAAKKFGASEIVDPRKYAVGVIRELYSRYPNMKEVLPSTGYNEQQLHDLEETINRAEADSIILGSPADVTRLISVNKPVVRVSWELVIREGPSISDLVDEFLKRVKSKK